jgi:hypothetical protein
MHLFLIIMYKRCLAVVLLFCCMNSVAQTADSLEHFGFRKGEERLSLLIGYNGLKNHFGEIGVAKNRLDGVGFHALGWSYFLSSEIELDNDLIVGPKLGGWFGGGVGAFALGLNTIVYTDFEEASWRLRPEVGFGLDVFKIVYGYNFALTNKTFEGINDHNFSIIFLLRLRSITSAEK